MSGLSEAQGLTASSDINNGNITSCTISNSPISGSTGSFTTVSADGAAGFNADVTVSGKLTVGQAVSALSLHVNNVVSAGSIVSNGTIIPSFAIVSAAGSAQATASLCSAQNCSLMGVADGQTTGFILMANKTGMAQTLYMNTAASANLYPPVGGTLNGGSTNAPVGLAANTLYTVLHYAASSMGVK